MASSSLPPVPGGRKAVKNLITGEVMYDTLHKARRTKVREENCSLFSIYLKFVLTLLCY